MASGQSGDDPVFDTGRRGADLAGDETTGQPLDVWRGDAGVTHGFGLFQLEDAEISGWSGYMTQPSRAFALAVFLHPTGKSVGQALPYLSARNVKLLKRADKQCRNHWAEELKTLL